MVFECAKQGFEERALKLEDTGLRVLALSACVDLPTYVCVSECACSVHRSYIHLYALQNEEYCIVENKW